MNSNNSTCDTVSTGSMFRKNNFRKEENDAVPLVLDREERRAGHREIGIQRKTHKRMERTSHPQPHTGGAMSNGTGVPISNSRN
jgi:hypothetical protein